MGQIWENSIDINTLPCVKQLASEKQLCSRGTSAQYSDDLEGWDGWGKETVGEGDICPQRADSHCCTTESNTTLPSNYTPVKKEIKANTHPSVKCCRRDVCLQLAHYLKVILRGKLRLFLSEQSRMLDMP